ncbi:MAG: hypothetical protein V1739_00340 [Candidatus Omnitrophota bacterium]
MNYKKIKFSLIFRIISLVLIQAFLIMGIAHVPISTKNEMVQGTAWAGNVNLSPKITLNTDLFKNAYFYGNYKEGELAELEGIEAVFKQQKELLLDSLKITEDRYRRIREFKDKMLDELKEAQARGVSSLKVSQLWQMSVRTVMEIIAKSVIEEAKKNNVAVIIMGSLARVSDFSLVSDIDFVVIASNSSYTADAQYYERQIKYGLQAAGFKLDDQLSDIFNSDFRTPEKIPELLVKKEIRDFSAMGMDIAPIDLGVNPIITNFFFDTEIIFGSEEVYNRLRQIVKPHLSEGEIIASKDGLERINLEKELMKDINASAVLTLGDLEKIDIKKRLLRNIQTFVWINRIRHNIIEEKDIVKVVDVLVERSNLSPYEAKALKSALEFGVRVRNNANKISAQVLAELPYHLNAIDTIIAENLGMPELKQASLTAVAAMHMVHDETTKGLEDEIAKLKKQKEQLIYQLYGGGWVDIKSQEKELDEQINLRMKTYWQTMKDLLSNASRYGVSNTEIGLIRAKINNTILELMPDNADEIGFMIDKNLDGMRQRQFNITVMEGLLVGQAI